MINAWTMLILAAAGATEPSHKVLQQEAIARREQYLQCVRVQLPDDQLPTRRSTSRQGTASQRLLFQKALDKCLAERNAALAASINLKSSRETPETAFELRKRMDADLTELEQGRYRVWFNLGWTH